MDDPENPVGVERLAHDFHLAELLKRSSIRGVQGEAAQRVLESIYVQTSFYLVRDAFERKDYSKALMVLTIASRIYPDRGFVWYNIGAAQARLGHKKEALDALDRALAGGYHDAAHTLTDDDLASLREETRFHELTSKMRVADQADPHPR